MADVVAKRVREHAVPRLGVTNRVLRNFCTRLCSDLFKGVFSADCIPPSLAARAHFIIIVNLSQKRGPSVGHFITIAASPSSVQYIDPYGLPCWQPDILSFLHSCKRKIRLNLRQVQSFKSSYCGLYALLFACYLDRKRWKGNKFKLVFERKKLRENDKLCVAYLKKIVSMM